MRKSTGTRIIDIARKLNVSSAVVSKVLSGAGNKNIRVSEAKAEMIRATAVEMNYSPNINARALAGCETKVIGVLIDSRGPSVTFHLLAEIEKNAAEHGYRMLVGEAHDNVENLVENHSILFRHGVDGIICISHDYPEGNEKVKKLFQDSEKTVFIGGPEIIGKPHVILDFEDGIADLTRHLVAGGRKRIAISVASRKFASVKKRIAGFLSVLPGHENMIFDTAAVAAAEPNADKMRANMASFLEKTLIPQKIDALIIDNDIAAFILLGELNKRGIRVPEDIAIGGHDDEFFAACSEPPITTVNENNPAVASVAVNMLLNMINGTVPTPETVHIKPKLVIRKST